jgi:hypothetical protein
MSKVIYEPHPVSEARKKELRDQGYTIVDAIYAPEDAGTGSEPVVRGRRGAQKSEPSE